MDARLHDAIVRTIKGLAIDAIEAAQSGHPGLPLGMADVATVLFTRFLRHDPAWPTWPNRDRFVLSAGHGSMLLYSLLHLTGYDLPLEELKRFRQLHSKTPGHPEVGETPGVETTTGPLGQGFANGVGMAMAERILGGRLVAGGTPLIDHFTYAIVSDGDVMEGVAAEAASLAGHLGLGKLIYLYDDNKITIDGPTSLAFTEDVYKRFDAYGWHTDVIDGHDREAIAAAIERAQRDPRPSLIGCRTIIGKGSTLQGKSKIHSDAVGPAEVRKIKENVGLPPEATFFIADEVRAYFAADRSRLAGFSSAWRAKLESARTDASFAKLYDATYLTGLPSGVEAHMPAFEVGKQAATRNVSGQVLQVLAKALPTLVGGSADLTPSNKTAIAGEPIMSREHPGARNIAYGVREHAMGGILNGMALHGGVRPYAGTFLTFSDYMRASVRLAGLMHQAVTYVFTHDSIFLGEDGPTHQSVEHVMSLRLIPNVAVDRPADGKETVAAWLEAMRRDRGPSALALMRQNVPHLAETSVEGARRGGYVVIDGGARPRLVLIGTGSELFLCVEAARALQKEGVAVRVVSLPCWSRFDAQDAAYRESVLPRAARLRLAVEAGVTLGWERYVGLDGRVIGIDRFGASAPYEQLAEHFGFTTANVVRVAREMLATA